ncbi:MAG: putative DNA binding domain-containing protein [Christensenellaceae bacterium]|jgi:ATP-dependent DNA helicase RecG|nr:putative DNA binding domain-containing protein [Christensenellaceae bacterium]
MQYIENICLELKSEYTDDIKKSVIALANTKGGRIIIGINDDGHVVGLSNSDDTALRVVQSCRNSIVPDITSSIEVKKEIIDEKEIVVIKVSKDFASYPYYLRDKGLKFGGVFVRVGSSTVSASDEHIREMIMFWENKYYCEQPCSEKRLTFATARALFKEKKLKFSDPQKLTLGIINSERKYTNLGFLISDQCKHTIKIAVFNGKSKFEFLDRTECGGSILKQLEDACSFIKLHNHKSVKNTKNGLKELFDYPLILVREALLNAIIHRDYSFGLNTFVNIYDDRLEILSFGELPYGLNVQEIKNGYSMLRNPSLARIFFKLGIIEAYGTGIPRIFKFYEKNELQPQIIPLENTFAIEFPNINYTEKVDDTEEF